MSQSTDESCRSEASSRCCKCVTKQCVACSCVKHGRQCISCRFGERCPNREGPVQQSPNETDLADDVANIKRNGRVLPRIPKSARIAVAGALAQRVAAVVSDGTPEAWKALLCFAYAVLRAPESRRDKSSRKSLASEIRQNIATFDDEVTTTLTLPRRAVSLRTADAATGKEIARRVTSKLADGDVRGALRALTSDDSFASPSSEVVAQITDKHPEPPSDLRDIQPPAEDTVTLIATEADVLRAITSSRPVRAPVWTASGQPLPGGPTRRRGRSAPLDRADRSDESRSQRPDPGLRGSGLLRRVFNSATETRRRTTAYSHRQRLPACSSQGRCRQRVSWHRRRASTSPAGSRHS